MAIPSSRSLIFEVKSTESELAFRSLWISVFSITSPPADFRRLRKTSDFFGNLQKWSCRLQKSQHSQDKNLTLIYQKKLAGILLLLFFYELTILLSFTAMQKLFWLTQKASKKSWPRKWMTGLKSTVMMNQCLKWVVSLDKGLYSTLSLFTQVYHKWVPATYCWGGNPVMD